MCRRVLLLITKVDNFSLPIIALMVALDLSLNISLALSSLSFSLRICISLCLLLFLIKSLETQASRLFYCYFMSCLVIFVRSEMFDHLLFFYFSFSLFNLSTAFSLSGFLSLEIFNVFDVQFAGPRLVICVDVRHQRISGTVNALANNTAVLFLSLRMLVGDVSF